MEENLSEQIQFVARFVLLCTILIIIAMAMYSYIIVDTLEKSCGG